MATAAPTRASSAAADDRANISRVPYLPGLDGMRALAVVAVMIYHANSDWLSGGFLGVEMFFVISGYLITLLIIAERERTYTVSLVDFWKRRARRLLPALFVLLVLVTAYTVVFEPDAVGQLRGDVVAGILFGSNWYQLFVGLGYTAAFDFAPLRHLWSLAVEEQFYLVWPLVMVALLGRKGTRRVAELTSPGVQIVLDTGQRIVQKVQIMNDACIVLIPLLLLLESCIVIITHALSDGIFVKITLAIFFFEGFNDSVLLLLFIKLPHFLAKNFICGSRATFLISDCITNGILKSFILIPPKRSRKSFNHIMAPHVRG